MRAIPISQAPVQFRTYLSSSTLSAGDVVALSPAGLLVRADKSNADLTNVVGFMIGSNVAGAVVAVPAQFTGIVQNSAWSFATGKPVYVNSSGGVTQITSSFGVSDWVIELGTAIGVNQIQINIRRAVARKVVPENADYAVSSNAVVEYVASVHIIGADYT